MAIYEIRKRARDKRHDVEHDMLICAFIIYIGTVEEQINFARRLLIMFYSYSHLCYLTSEGGIIE